MTTAELTRMHDEVKALARERGAVILAHNYQVPEVQDVADYVGDSLGLSRQAAATDADAIVFCGVHFMAETAKILSPEKTVLIPDPDAGCSLAVVDHGRRSCARWKAENPGAVVVSYVNTTAEVKAETDYCCTSGNAKAVIEAIPRDQEILFLPDMYLGLWLEKVTGRKLNIWLGECHVHAGIRPAGHRALAGRGAGRRAARPSRVRLRVAGDGVRQRAHAHPLDRGDDQLREAVAEAAHARRDRDRDHPPAREGGAGQALRARATATPFCKYMKMITLEKLRDSLRDWKYEVDGRARDRRARPRRDRADGRRCGVSRGWKDPRVHRGQATERRRHGKLNEKQAKLFTDRNWGVIATIRPGRLDRM